VSVPVSDMCGDLLKLFAGVSDGRAGPQKVVLVCNSTGRPVATLEDLGGEAAIKEVADFFTPAPSPGEAPGPAPAPQPRSIEPELLLPPSPWPTWARAPPSGAGWKPSYAIKKRPPDLMQAPCRLVPGVDIELAVDGGVDDALGSLADVCRLAGQVSLDCGVGHVEDALSLRRELGELAQG
jgi:hypothetical protein